jgi:hypothetical protein
MTQLARVSLRVFLKRSFESHIRLNENTRALHLIKGHLIWHPLLLDQIADYQGCTPAYSRRANYQYGLIFRDVAVDKGVCLIKMLLNRKIWHIIKVKDFKMDAVSFVVHEVLSDAVHTVNCLDICLKKTVGIQR